MGGWWCRWLFVEWSSGPTGGGASVSHRAELHLEVADLGGDADLTGVGVDGGGEAAQVRCFGLRSGCSERFGAGSSTWAGGAPCLQRAELALGKLQQCAHGRLVDSGRYSDDGVRAIASGESQGNGIGRGESLDQPLEVAVGIRVPFGFGHVAMVTGSRRAVPRSRLRDLRPAVACNHRPNRRNSSRRCTPSLAKARPRCPSTVRTDTTRRSAISRLDRPWEANVTSWRSRAVSCAARSPVAGRVAPITGECAFSQCAYQSAASFLYLALKEKG